MPIVSEDAMPEFRRNDPGYRRWSAAHPGQRVLNIHNSLATGDARIHRANCPTITGRPTRGQNWTIHYIKVCLPRNRDLDAWVRRNIPGQGTPIPRCRRCRP